MGLKWREQLSVGNDLIDDDHKYLIDLINKAEDNLKSVASENLKATLHSLSEYAKLHFSKEEAIAQAAGYPDAAHLHQSHAALLTQLAQVKSELGAELSETTSEHLMDFLRNWLIDHVIKEDLLMKPFLTKFSPKFDPRK